MSPQLPLDPIRCAPALVAGPGGGPAYYCASWPWTGLLFPIRGSALPDGERGCIPTRDAWTRQSAVEHSVGPFGCPVSSIPPRSGDSWNLRGTPDPPIGPPPAADRRAA